MGAMGTSPKVKRALQALLAVCVPVALFAADPPPPKPKPAPPPPAGKVARPRAAKFQEKKEQVQNANKEARAAQQALNAPVLMKLAQMSPEEREAALAKLPPQRRAQLEQRLDAFSMRPPEEQARDLRQAQKIASLPRERQDVVRSSLAQYNTTPPPRRGVIGMELNKLSSMTDEQRSAYINSKQFRGRFSAEEIDMMNNLHGIVP